MFSTNQLQIELYLNNALQPFKSMTIDKKNYDQQINLNDINLRELNISAGTHVISIIVTDMDNGNMEMATINLTVTGDVETGDGILNLVEETSWKIGYVDPRAADEEIESQMHRKYRTFDIASKNWVQMIKEEIEPAYNCVCLFDGVNKLINVYHIDTLSEDKGFYISEKNYLKHIKKEPKFGEIYTKLNIYGKDNLSINSVNPSGKSYIFDFSYYMDNGYMTEDLKNAIIAYNTLLESNKGQFKIYLDQLKEQQTILATKETEMSTLENDLTIIQDDIDLAIQASQDLTTLNAAKSAKETEITSKQSEIDGVNAQIQSIQNSITSLATLLDEKSNFTPEQWDELDNFIEEKDWQDSRIFEVDELYKAGQDALKKLNSPQLDFDVEMVDLFSMLEGDSELDRVKMTMGNIVYIGFERLSIDIAQRLVGYTHDVDGHSLKGNFTNRDKKDDAMRQLTDSISQAINAGVSVGMNKGIWDKSQETGDWVNDFIDKGMDATKYAIESVRNGQQIRIDERGVKLASSNNPGIIRMLNNIIALSEDGENYSLAITPQGIIAEKLVGRVLLTSKLHIADETGQMKIEGNLLTVKDDLNKIRVLLGNYDKINGKYGLQMFSKSDGNVVIISEDGLMQTDTIQIADNVDESHPLILRFYIDDNVLSVNKVKLAFSIEHFRTYEKSIIGGSSSKSTSDLSTGLQNVFVARWEDPMGTRPAPETLGQLYAPVNGSEIDLWWLHHTHNINHSHGMNHTHTNTLEYGIYEGSLTSNVSIVIDSVPIPGIYDTTQSNIDLTQYITTPGWHTIELHSASLGRLNASLYIKSFVGM